MRLAECDFDREIVADLRLAHVHLKLDTHSLVTLADPAQRLNAGDQVTLEFAEPLYFDQAGNRIAFDGVHAW